MPSMIMSGFGFVHSVTSNLCGSVSLKASHALPLSGVGRRQRFRQKGNATPFAAIQQGVAKSQALPLLSATAIATTNPKLPPAEVAGR